LNKRWAKTNKKSILIIISLFVFNIKESEREEKGKSEGTIVVVGQTLQFQIEKHKRKVCQIVYVKTRKILKIGKKP
jgi:hypothetical protein